MQIKQRAGEMPQVKIGYMKNIHNVNVHGRVRSEKLEKRGLKWDLKTMPNFLQEIKKHLYKAHAALNGFPLRSRVPKLRRS